MANDRGKQIEAVLNAQNLISRGSVEEAFLLLEGEANDNNAFAQHEWGRALCSGLVADRARHEGLPFLELARTSNHPASAYFLASIAIGDVLIPFEERQIRELLLESASLNFMPAWRAFGLLLASIEDTKAHHLAFQCLSLASQMNDRISSFLLSSLQHLSPRIHFETHSQTPATLLKEVASVLPQNFIGTGANGIGTTRHRIKKELNSGIGLNIEEKVVSPLECNYLHAMSASLMRPSQVRDPHSGRPMPHPIRSSFEANFDFVHEDFNTRLIQAKMAKCMGLPISHAENLVVLKYRVGQEYRLHRDTLPESALRSQSEGGAGQRQATAILYLCDVAEGGTTVFPLCQQRITPRLGRVVSFRNIDQGGQALHDSLHAGEPPIKGEKWISTLWFREGKIREI